MVMWMSPKIDDWAGVVRTLGRYSTRHAEAAYIIPEISLKLEWEYLRQDFLGIRAFLGSVQEALIGGLLPVMGEDRVSQRLIGLLDLSTKHAGLVIPSPVGMAY